MEYILNFVYNCIFFLVGGGNEDLLCTLVGLLCTANCKIYRRNDSKHSLLKTMVSWRILFFDDKLKIENVVKIQECC